MFVWYLLCLVCSNILPTELISGYHFCLSRAKRDSLLPLFIVCLHMYVHLFVYMFIVFLCFCKGCFIFTFVFNVVLFILVLMLFLSFRDSERNTFALFLFVLLLFFCYFECCLDFCLKNYQNLINQLFFSSTLFVVLLCILLYFF